MNVSDYTTNIPWLLFSSYIATIERSGDPEVSESASIGIVRAYKIVVKPRSFRFYCIIYTICGIALSSVIITTVLFNNLRHMGDHGSK